THQDLSLSLSLLDCLDLELPLTSAPSVHPSPLSRPQRDIAQHRTLLQQMRCDYGRVGSAPAPVCCPHAPGLPFVGDQNTGGLRDENCRITSNLPMKVNISS